MWENSYVCGGATEEGYWRVLVLSPPIWRDDWHGGCSPLVCFHQEGFKDLSTKEELLTLLPLKGYTGCEIEDIFNASLVGLVNETTLLLFNCCWWDCRQSQVPLRLGKLRSWGPDVEIAKWHWDKCQINIPESIQCFENYWWQRGTPISKDVQLICATLLSRTWKSSSSTDQQWLITTL